MSIGLPTFEIDFIQKAVTAITRSERGIACIVVYDDTVTDPGYATYKYAADVPKTSFTEANYNAIQKCWLVSVNKVIVAHVPTAAEFATVQAILEKLSYNYVCVVNSEAQAALVSYIISKNNQSKGKKYVAVVANVTTADSKYVINLKGDWVHEVGAGANTPMVNYLPRMTSILANLPLNRSITYYELEDLDKVDDSYITIENDADSWVNKGWLLLLNDEDGVLVGRGVNTLTTFTSTDTEDMRKIIIMEALNLIIEDIYKVFKANYVGKYKNYLDNQYLFISAINTYFRNLGTEEVLDPEFNNLAQVDVESQRNAWLGIGKTTAADWDEDTVKKMTFKSYVFLAGDIKVLDAVEDLKFAITLE